MISTLLTTQLLQLNRDEINEVYDVLKHRSHSLAQQEKAAFSVGDEVYWISKKQKGKRIGKVMKVMKKNVKVRVGYAVWTVHPSFLHHVDEDAEEPTFNPATGAFE
ncbi:MAG: hypothetical protein HOC79_05730 [Euryarchaeota archaeon]|jgi:hypothetical protein|nr:hypothetical protein [Euryarchaeota archaeon]